MLNNRIEPEMEMVTRRVDRRRFRKEKRINTGAHALPAASDANQTNHTTTQAKPTIAPANRLESHTTSQQKKKKHIVSRELISTIEKVVEELQAIVARLVV